MNSAQTPLVVVARVDDVFLELVVFRLDVEEVLLDAFFVLVVFLVVVFLAAILTFSAAAAVVVVAGTHPIATWASYAAVAYPDRYGGTAILCALSSAILLL